MGARPNSPVLGEVHAYWGLHSACDITANRPITCRSACATEQNWGNYTTVTRGNPGGMLVNRGGPILVRADTRSDGEWNKATCFDLAHKLRWVGARGLGSQRHVPASQRCEFGLGVVRLSPDLRQRAG